MNTALETSLINLFACDTASSSGAVSDLSVRELCDLEVLCAAGGETLVNFG